MGALGLVSPISARWDSKLGWAGPSDFSVCGFLLCELWSNLLLEGYIGDDIGFLSRTGLTKGDTGSLDYSSCFPGRLNA